MIGQCLLNKNESATVSKSKKKSHLNKALSQQAYPRTVWRPLCSTIHILRDMLMLIASGSFKYIFSCFWTFLIYICTAEFGVILQPGASWLYRADDRYRYRRIFGRKTILDTTSCVRVAGIYVSALYSCHFHGTNLIYQWWRGENW